MGKADLGEREMRKFIKENGLKIIRQKGSHKRYLLHNKNKDKITLTIPMNKMKLQKICKQYGLRMPEGS